MHVVFPDGTAPDFGDADDARGLWFRADCPADYRGLLALGAVLFQRGDFKAAAGRVTEEVFWLLGLDGVSRFEDLAPRPADDASAAYPDGGYYVMRGGWGASDPVLVFDCGPLGFGPAGHGHADALSIQLHSAGYPYLVDSGTFSYNLDYSWRNVFRSTRAHNTVAVDGQSQSVPQDRMAWDSVAQAKPHQWITTRWFDLADGEHNGYGRLADPVTHRRVVVFLKPDVWVIWDDLRGRQHHTLELLFHARPDCRVEADPGGVARLVSPNRDQLYASISAERHRAPSFEVIGAGEGDRGAWFSHGYGARVPSHALSARHEFDGGCSLVTCLSMAEPNRPTVTHQHGLLGFRVQHDEGGEERMWYRTDGITAAEEEGTRFDGTLLFHRSTPATKVVCARSFQELSLDGLLEVRAPAPIDSLVLDEDRCEILVAEDCSRQLHVRVREGIRLVVNGRHQPAGTCGVRPLLVTA